MVKVMVEIIEVEEVAEVAEAAMVLQFLLNTVGHMVFACMLAPLVVHQQQDIKPQLLSPIAWVEAIVIAQQSQHDGVGAKIQH